MFGDRSGFDTSMAYGSHDWRYFGLPYNIPSAKYCTISEKEKIYTYIYNFPCSEMSHLYAAYLITAIYRLVRNRKKRAQVRWPIFAFSGHTSLRQKYSPSCLKEIRVPRGSYKRREDAGRIQFCVDYHSPYYAQTTSIESTSSCRPVERQSPNKVHLSYCQESHKDDISK